MQAEQLLIFDFYQNVKGFQMRHEFEYEKNEEGKVMLRVPTARKNVPMGFSIW